MLTQAIHVVYVGLIGGEFHVSANPAFLGIGNICMRTIIDEFCMLLLAEREAVFNQVYAAYQANMATLSKEEIEVTLPDGTVKTGTSHETTPYEIAKSISQVTNHPTKWIFFLLFV